MITAPARISMIDRPNTAAQEWTALMDILALGVTLGEPVTLSAEQTQGGHLCCDFHLIDTEASDEDYREVDGGAASSLLSNLKHGYYPRTGRLTIHRVLDYIPESVIVDEKEDEQ